MILRAYQLAQLIALLLLLTAGLFVVQAWSTDSSPSDQDPVLRAMLAELQRSKTQLKLADTQPPYYVDYRLVDTDQYVAEAAFGALRTSMRTRIRTAAASLPPTW